MAQPLVSIIMPSYQTPPDYLRQAVESVLAQTYDRWELLLIDDGSGAESAAAAREQAGRDERIRYLEHPGHANRGASVSRQVAIERAAGDVFALLDADDLWLPHKLEQQIAILEGHPEVGALYGSTRYWYGWAAAGPGTPADFEPPLGLPDGSIHRPPELLVRFLRGEVAVPCTCSLVLTREAMERSGGFATDYSGIYDDQIFYARVFLNATVYVSATCWDWYRQHPDSGCHVASRRGEMYDLRLEYLDWLARHLETREVDHPELWRTVARERWLYRRPGWWPRSWHPALRWTRKWWLRAGLGPQGC